jgi:hypothetical protein
MTLMDLFLTSIRKVPNGNPMKKLEQNSFYSTSVESAIDINHRKINSIKKKEFIESRIYFAMNKGIK